MFLKTCQCRLPEIHDSVIQSSHRPALLPQRSTGKDRGFEDCPQPTIRMGTMTSRQRSPRATARSRNQTVAPLVRSPSANLFGFIEMMDWELSRGAKRLKGTVEHLSLWDPPTSHFRTPQILWGRRRSGGDRGADSM